MFQSNLIEKTKDIIYQNNNDTNIHTKKILDNIFYHMENDINNENLFKEKIEKVFLINEELTELYKKLGNLILLNYNSILHNNLYVKLPVYVDVIRLYCVSYTIPVILVLLSDTNNLPLVESVVIIVLLFVELFNNNPVESTDIFVLYEYVIGILPVCPNIRYPVPVIP
jgi:hypothetical protein